MHPKDPGSLVSSASQTVLCLETQPHLRQGPRKSPINKIVVEKQNSKVAASPCPYVWGRNVLAKPNTFRARAGFLSRKRTEASECPGWLSALPTSQDSCTLSLRFSCKLPTSILVEKGYFIRAFVKIPCFTLGKALVWHLVFEHYNHSIPQKFLSFAPILMGVWCGVESDPIVSASTALHEQCSHDMSKCWLLFRHSCC